MKRAIKLCSKIILLVAVLSLMPLSSAVQPVAAAETSSAPAVAIQWEQVSPMPRPRHAGATAVNDGIIYTIGGIEPPGEFEFIMETPAGKMPIKVPGIVTGVVVETYDPKTDKWTTKAPLPYPPNPKTRRSEGRTLLAAAAYKDKIYTFGGANVYQEVKDTVDVYDIASNTWKANIAKLPKPAAGMSAVTYGDKIYLFGGSAKCGRFTAEDFYSQCYEFDPATAKFTPKANMPNPRTGTVALVLKNRILVLGGTSAYGNSSAQLYDPSTDSWSFAEPVEWERPYWFGATANDMIFLVAGRNEHQITCTTVDVYSDLWQTWVTGTNTLSPREDAFIASVDGKLYVMGGRDNKGNPNSQGDPVTSAERGTPPSAPPTIDFTPPAPVTPEVIINWSDAASMPTPRCHGPAVVVNNIIYTIGGLGSGAPSKSVEAYDPASNKWIKKASLPEARFMFGAAAYNGKIYTFGGVNDKLQVVDTVDIYDVATDTWKASAAKLPKPTAGTSAVTYKDTIYLFGGGKSPINFVPSAMYFDNVYKFDPVALTFTPAKPMPVARNMTFTCVVGSNVYILAGFASPGATGNTSYSVETESSTTKEPMPEMRGGSSGAEATTNGDSATAGESAITAPGIKVAHAASSLLVDRIFIIGGAKAQKSILSYDTKANKWGQASPLRVGRNLPFVATVETVPGNACIYVAGGLDSKGNILSNVEKGTLAETVAEPTAEPKKTEPAPKQPASGKGMGCAKAESSSGMLSDASPLLLGVLVVALVFSSRSKRKK